MTTVPIYSIFCTEYTYVDLTNIFFQNYLEDPSANIINTTGGGALSLGYEQYCNTFCNSIIPYNPCNKYNSCKPCKPCKPCNSCNKCTKQIWNPCNKPCNNPCNNIYDNPTMKVLKYSLVQNINISLNIQSISEIYLLNHQNCAVIRKYLACSGYPANEANNVKEIQINSYLLIFAKNYIQRKFPSLTSILALIDVNGSVATYDISMKIWTVIYVGDGTDESGLWFGLSEGDIYSS